MSFLVTTKTNNCGIGSKIKIGMLIFFLLTAGISPMAAQQ